MTEQLIANRYKTVALLGKGGMGEVYKAEDPVLGIEVAVKVLPAKLAELGAARLQREAKALAKLNHPNIARVLDFAQDDTGAPYMVLEYLAGQSLDKLIKERKPAQKTAINIFIQICRGLEYAHNAGIIHRDLKPSNILVLEEDEKHPEVKILDFGVAKVASENQKLTATDALVGSPIYMSPEQIEGLAVTPPTDIYSLGCLMFETLTGKPPFKGASSIETFSMHKTTAPPLISEIDPNAGYPEDLVKLIDQCLSKSPANRPQSAKEIVETLDQIKIFIESGKVSRAKEDIEKTAPEKENKFGGKSGLILAGSLLILITISSPYLFQNSSQTVKKVPNKISTSDEHEAEIQKEERDSIEPEEKFRFNKLGDGRVVVSSSFPVKDDDLSQLQKIRNLGAVDFINSKISGPGLTYLLDKPIQNIRLEKCLLTDEYANLFLKMDLLKVLHLESPLLTDKAAQTLGQAKRLDTLALVSDLVTDCGVSHISNMSGLTVLCLSSKKMTSNGIEPLSKLNYMRYLKLAELTCKPGFGKNLSQCRTLSILTISRAQNFSADYLKGIEKSSVTSVILEDLNVDKACVDTILRCPSTYSLELNACKIDDSAFVSAGNFKNLKNLHIFNTDTISDQMIEDICKTQVNELNFKACSISNTQSLRFGSLKSLDRLTIQDCNVSQETLDEIGSTYRRYFKRNLVVLD